MNILTELLKGISSNLKNNDEIKIQSITNDSREVAKGALFLAYPGFHVDGRDYIQNAIDQGAVAICYDPIDFNLSIQTNIPCVSVPALKKQEALIAARFYDFPSKKLSIIGVTGTNGKTSVTHFIAQALGRSCAVIGTTGYGFLPDLKKSLNTTPDGLRLQAMLADCVSNGADSLAMEVSSHALVEKRVDQVLFETAVFTNLTREHLDFHGTMEDYRDAKALIFQQAGLKNAVINADDPVARYMIQSVSSNVNVYTYSSKSDSTADIVATHFIRLPKSIVTTIKTPWGSGDIKINLLGEFNLQNCLAVIGVLGVHGVPFQKILEAIAQIKPPPGRMSIYHQKGYPAVAIDYAHTPDALEKALSALRNHGEAKVWCVFGCGGERDHGKRAEMGAIAERLSDHVVLTNDNPRSESPEAIAKDILSGISHKNVAEVILDRESAIKYVIKNAGMDDLVLIAGKGHETTQVIGDQVLAFSDCDTVMKLLNLNSDEPKL